MLTRLGWPFVITIEECEARGRMFTNGYSLPFRRTARNIRLAPDSRHRTGDVDCRSEYVCFLLNSGSCSRVSGRSDSDPPRTLRTIPVIPPCAGRRDMARAHPAPWSAASLSDRPMTSQVSVPRPRQGPVVLVWFARDFQAPMLVQRMASIPLRPIVARESLFAPTQPPPRIGASSCNSANGNTSSPTTQDHVG